MTVQQGIGLAAVCVAALNAYLIAADTSNEIPHVYMLALGGANVVLGAASVFFGNATNMARTLLTKRPHDPRLSTVADK